MKFQTREDIEAPIDYVFSQVSDFASLERSMLRRGMDVERIADRDPVAPGIKWNTAFDLRGKRREMQLELIDFEPPAMMRFIGTSKSLDGDLEVDLVALSRGRTRLALAADLKPQSLSARLMVQSLKLARATATKRFEMRIAAFAKDLEDRYSRSA